MSENTTSEKPRITAIAPWFGSKRTMAPRIARECCRADGRAPKSFWELCCGSMAVSLAMPRCSHHHVVDKHPDLMNLARVIQDPHQGPRFYRQLRRILSHERLFREAKAAIEGDDLRAALELGNLFSNGNEQLRAIDPFERAILYFIVSWQGRNGVAGTERVNYQQALRWTSGGGHGGIRFSGAVESIPQWRRRMRSITLLERDVFDVLHRIEDQDGTSIYIDPPYLRGGARSGSCTYLHEFTSADHERLASELKRFQKARVVISYYEHDWLRELYLGWTFVECTTQKNLHVQNRRGVGRCDAPEVLIINGISYTEGSKEG